MFVPGQVYKRRELHEQYGGQQQGGISTPARFSLVFAFTSDSGEQYGYKDGWQESGIFYYTGEGQRGDMESRAGNKAILEHADVGKDLHLFGQADKRSYVKYIGQFVCTGRHSRPSQDLDGKLRRALIFELTPIARFEVDELPGSDLVESVDRLTELRVLAEQDSADERAATARLTLKRYRSEHVRTFVLARAAGVCEACTHPAPFLTASGEAYLEAHHMDRLSDGGPDRIEHVAAVCANCHRRAHYSADREAFNSALRLAIREKMHLLPTC